MRNLCIMDISVVRSTPYLSNVLLVHVSCSNREIDLYPVEAFVYQQRSRHGRSTRRIIRPNHIYTVFDLTTLTLRFFSLSL